MTTASTSGYPAHLPSVSTLRISHLWRYPIKSLHGEQLDRAEITDDGLAGDRVLHVRGDRGLLTGRTRHALLTQRATTDTAGHALVDGQPWNSPATAELIRQRAGADARLARHTGPERFDVLPLLVATQADIDRLAVDGRRLRPNLVISGAQPGQERGWPGQSLHIGPDVILGVDSVRLRCIVTTIDPDDGAQDLNVLRRINRDFDGRIALNCWVIRGGTIHQHDTVRVEPQPARAATTHPGYDSWVAGARYTA
jgi:uncharacterized protein YcbX